MGLPTSVLLAATAWGPAHGGINAFNAELAEAFARTGLSVCCVVPSANPDEIVSARAAGVTLVGARLAPGTWPVDSAPALIAALTPAQQESTLWMGHDLVTGPIMRAAHRLTASKAILTLVHHMHYLSYKAMESSAEDAERRHAQQKELFAQADVVIAVGPKLARTAQDHLRGLVARPAFSELIPGLTITRSCPAPHQFQAFFAGRISGQTARLKQTTLAAASFGRALATERLGSDPVLTMIGSEDAATDGKYLSAVAAKEAGRRANINVLPFSHDRPAFLSRLSEHTVAMQLSVHEGFGLTAWEAIGAGVPLILSVNSGVYEVLRRIGGTATGCVRTVDIRGSTDLDTPFPSDVDAVSRHLLEVSTSPLNARADAIALLDQLRDYTWERAAVTILDAAGCAPSPPMEREPPALEPAASTGPVAIAAPPRLSNADPLFDIYTTSCQPYYLERALDDDLRLSVGVQSIWLWGDSGVGKTTALRRWAMGSGQYIYVSPAACPAGGLLDVLINLYAELCQAWNIECTTLSTSTSDTIRRIVRLVCASPPAIIHIDELPDVVTDSPDIYAHLAAIISALATSAPHHRTRFALSTLADPRPHVPMLRVRERLRFKHLPTWSVQDVQRLIDRILAFTSISLSEPDRTMLQEASRGSPRFVKTCLRKLQIYRDSPDWSFPRILDTSTEEIFS